MGVWDRRTLWRQGHVLTEEAVTKLGLDQVHQGEDAVVVVISHDCDLLQVMDKEPDVELIPGYKIPEPNGNYTYAKSPRCLHLAWRHNGANLYVELVAKNKRTLPKESLAQYDPNPAITLTPRNRTVLQQWLAARYRRTAFPDQLENCLRRAGLHRRIAKIIEPYGDHLIAILFDVDEGRDSERTDPDDPYALSIDVLYNTEENPGVAESAAKEVAAALTAAFHKHCFDEKTGWQGIELLGCDPIADMEIPYARAVQLRRWNADYMSLRADDRS